MECYNNDGSKAGVTVDVMVITWERQMVVVWPSANPLFRVEDALKNGLANMVFGNRLYQKDV